MKLLIAGIVIAGACAVASADEAEILEIELRLMGGLRAADAPADAPENPSLLVDLTRTGDRFQRVWAVSSHSRKMQFLTGCVTTADVSQQRIVLDILLGGQTIRRVHVDLKREAGNELNGTYNVVSPSGTIEGTADGRIKPPRLPLPPGFEPVKPGERPRILFRRSQIPALKEKLATPLGRVIFEKMGDEKAGDAIGAGVKYQLTGRREFADQARALATLQMAGQAGRYSQRTAWGRRPKQVAVAYDLCYDAWPEEFRRQVRDYLLDTADTYTNSRMSGGINWHVSSNWGAKIYAGLAFIGLALWGEPGDMPPEPAADGPDAQARQTLWQFEVAEWQRLGTVNMDYQRIFETGRQLMYWHCREAIGSGGFRGECAHYGLKGSEMTAEYAPCYRRMFGHDLSPYPDITHLLPRLVFCHHYPATWQPFGETEVPKGVPLGRPIPLNINGWSDIWGNYFTSLYEITPEKWQPAMLWAWNRQLGITGPEGAAKLLQDRDMDEHGTAYPAAFFLGYPTDPSAAARHPAECMPLTWQAPDMGYYGFRNGWRGDGEIALHVYAKTRHIGGWKGPNAGSFRLFGFGESFNDDDSGREIRQWMANRVVLPDDETYVDGCGRVVRADAAPDGSGSITIDLTDSYSGPTSHLYSLYGGIRHAAAFKDNGISALRAIAVDYSGKCGAPCLFVLVDRIDGGKSKVWTWNLGDAEAVESTEARGNTFTLARGGATLHGTFVAPAKAEVTVTINEVRTVLRKGESVLKIPSILARGGNAFFLVATLQGAETTPPEVKTTGAGLNAAVTVGARRVTFDGSRILIVDARPAP